MSEQKLIVMPAHMRSAGMCLIPGTRDFFKRHGLDFKAFIKGGIDAELLIATGDAMALQVVDVAKRDLAHGQK